jgi:HEPN domain-containing protein
MAQPVDEISYRLALAEGFLREGRQDQTLSRWRSCVDNCQLVAENAAKSALALLGPVGRTHNPAPLLREALQRGDYPATVRSRVQRLAECSEFLGPDIHVQSDYGDESSRQTPWDLFDEDAAAQALALAEEAFSIAREIISEFSST